MRNNFYSFSDAFREANRKQKIEYFTSEQEQAQLTATRRQFRSFLIALDIEYAIVRTPEDGKLWYAAPGVQSDVLLLRMYANGRAIDENSFSGTLIVRSDAKKDKRWFAYYICDDHKATYIASSWDEIPDFSLTAVVSAPNIPGGNEEPIVIRAGFTVRSSAVARVQNEDLARAVAVQEQLRRSWGGTMQGHSEESYTMAYQSGVEKPNAVNDFAMI